MGFRRQAGAVVVAAAVALVVATASPAGSLDECAQRVIRDWYTGGRVDGVYPLPCYRAALRALPADVLQYSNADQDIRRALAYARRGRSDPGAAPAPPAAPPPAAAPAKKATAPATAPAKQPRADPGGREAEQERPAPVAKAAAPAPQPAGLAERTTASASIPYPILVLSALAAVLLTTGAAGWVLGRRR